ncbi:MAG: hypothetical protein KDC92_00885 [Bacteroidetes bacterium]|nr:hypothetical protein [Bacteroidota bacterium]
MRKLFILLVAAAFMASCAKDPNKEANENLEGTWSVNSVTMDGTQVFGPDNLINEATMVFAMTDDATGTVKTTITVFKGTPFESTDTENSTYEITEEATKIKLTDSDGKVTDGTMTLEDTNLTVSYTDEDGVAVVQKATKQ